VLALAGVLLCYGLVELAEGYGFIAAFVAGVLVHRADEKHTLHHRLHLFSEAVESRDAPGAARRRDARALAQARLAARGRRLWAHSGDPGSGGACQPDRQYANLARAGCHLYGVHGIGSLYYLGYASTNGEFVSEERSGRWCPIQSSPLP
jgi:hypothetical protein